ncbi:MAG: LPS translocon maturation chaperone LptM [Candidatus Malihini olakiniferum]
MKQVFRLFSLVLIVVGCVGCGLKGPLYIPNSEPNHITDAKKNMHPKPRMRPSTTRLYFIITITDHDSNYLTLVHQWSQNDAVR